MNLRLMLTALCTMMVVTPAAAQTPDLETIARASGTPEIPGLKIIWLAPWGDVGNAHPWRNIIVHQTEGPTGSARGGAEAQAKNPTRRGVTVWVETDGTVYWAVPETMVTTHGDGANRNDNKYIDNGPTFHQVVRDNSIGVEFAGNYPDVTRRATEAQIAAWRVLVKVLRARYRIPLDRVYAHNWIDFKDARYCEGCELATLARQWGSRELVCPGRCSACNAVLQIQGPAHSAPTWGPGSAVQRAGRCGACHRARVRATRWHRRERTLQRVRLDTD